MRPRRTLDLHLESIEVTSRVRAPVVDGSGGRAVPGPLGSGHRRHARAVPPTGAPQNRARGRPSVTP
ncbi:hypothetical protein BJF90_36890 [Pseudonocardia sp. CNS-004]|nr:hypothetical protein BJF90_36890 [Pseudonocardia sp. CNS-004]